ncbi:MAG: double zinc ribbon domain-containing protein [Mariprofundaceae bacterium]|nr:double zinc ribbon domain-containing protein [Mariprofundaceae bacterium]
MSLSIMQGIITAMKIVSTCRHWLFPASCLFCQQPLAGADHACCADCLADIHPWPIHHCYRCGKVLPPSLSPGPCGECLHQPPAYVSSTSLYQYRGAVRQAVLQWKRTGHDAAFRWLLTTADHVLRDCFHPDDLLLPIPMPLSRMRVSGMHHSADCCRLLAKRYGCQWQWQLLRRQGTQLRQSSLHAAQRQSNMRKAFTLNHDYLPAAGEFRRVWLIDDIITTGATMHYAARCLQRQGIACHAWALSHTPLD